MSNVSGRIKEIRWKLLAAQSELYLLYSEVPELAKEYDNRTVSHLLDDLNTLRHELDIAFSLIVQIDERVKEGE